MAQIIGQIESLKRLKRELSQSEVTRFNSIGEINRFLVNYESEIQEINQQAELNLKNEIIELQSQLSEFQKQYRLEKIEVTENLNSKILSIKSRITSLKSKDTSFLYLELINWVKLKLAALGMKKLEQNFSKIVHQHTIFIEQNVSQTTRKIAELTSNKERVLSDRCQPLLEQVSHTKKVVDGLYPLIAGAIGESAVVKELESLSDEFILINDYSLTFNPPIFNKKNNNRIYSVQIDHLLITRAGVFVPETKNWGRKSIENHDLRSPIDQIKRANYVLFTLLNSSSKYNQINLDNHHWGRKQIPIKNVVVMIHERPKERFQYVAIKSLTELVGYLTYFEPIFSVSEVSIISDFLIDLKE